MRPAPPLNASARRRAAARDLLGRDCSTWADRRASLVDAVVEGAQTLGLGRAGARYRRAGGRMGSTLGTRTLTLESKGEVIAVGDIALLSGNRFASRLSWQLPWGHGAPISSP